MNICLDILVSRFDIPPIMSIGSTTTTTTTTPLVDSDYVAIAVEVPRVGCGAVNQD